MDKAVSNVFANVSETHKKAVDAILGFNKIAVRTQSLLASQQMVALEKVLDAGSRNLQLVTETQDPRDLVTRQTEVAVELGETLVTVARETLDIQTQARDEVATLVKDGFEGIDMPSVVKTVKSSKKAA